MAAGALPPRRLLPPEKKPLMGEQEAPLTPPPGPHRRSAECGRHARISSLALRRPEMAKVAHRVSTLEGQQLLIIHATADEKIHFQHTAELITQLIKGKANYSLQVQCCTPALPHTCLSTEEELSGSATAPSPPPPSPADEQRRGSSRTPMLAEEGPLSHTDECSLGFTSLPPGEHTSAKYWLDVPEPSVAKRSQQGAGRYPPQVPLDTVQARRVSQILDELVKIYPDESHYFSSAPLRQHLYRALISFFVECFRIQDKLPAVAAKEDEEED
ncbi:hypothetical protein J1605_016066 [Eschrichtius robustus]|uniref:Uncharacterized protein n=1 Tax=Eschrichtius robustus TaxID=9764 RepID=A0AB34G8L9_ESCRO|nr:hypothetical protein J1605_016066 [Eschrichtius robustus]